MSAHPTGDAPSPAGATADGTTVPGPIDELEAVRRAARGLRKDFALDRLPLSEGGQAKVFGARNKPTGVRVAFKKLEQRHPGAAARARMRREVEAARRFGDHPHVLPVLDWSASYDWFAMPLADGSARDLAAELSRPAVLRALVTAVCSALREPHRQGWVHRDIKPDNILRFAGRWMVADWGLGRRPRGQTTHSRRTKPGVRYGSEGFAAPELSVDAHAAGPAADVYSIGQTIGWALTGQWPRQNIPLLPESGPWRTIVWAATLNDPERRVSTVDELLAMIAAEFDAPPASAAARGRQLLPAVRAGDESALLELLRLAVQSDLDDGFFQDVLTVLDHDRIPAAVAADPRAVGEVVGKLRLSAPGGSAGPQPADPGPALIWLLALADHAENVAQWDVLDAAGHAILHLDAGEQVSRDVHEQVLAWLTSRSDEAASVLAVVLRRCTLRPGLTGLAHDSTLDHRLRLALRARQQAEAAGPADGTESATAGREHTGRRWWAQRRRAVPLLLSAAAVITAGSVLVGTLVDDAPGQPQAPASVPGESAIGDPLRFPGQLAPDGMGMQAFVDGWDHYPSWFRCRSGSGKTALTGSFPAHPRQAGLPVSTIHCTTGGNLQAMFGDFKRNAYAQVARAYLDAAPPARPVGREKTPPQGLHVLAWSPTERAIVWTDPASLLIGVVITDSPGTDLVELWSRYRSR